MELVKKMQKKFSGWKSSHILLARKATLVKTMLEAMPFYSVDG